MTAPLFSWSQARLLSWGPGFDSRVGPKVVLGFYNRNFSVVARSLEVGEVIPTYFGKHVKPLVVSDCRPIGLRE